MKAFKLSVAAVTGLFVLAALSMVITSGSLATTTSVESQDLMAGKTTKVGVVEVWNDADYLYVKFKITNENWCLTDLHLAVATSIDGIPHTKTWNAIPGQFPYSASLSCASEHTFAIPLTWEAGTTLYIAAHAVVLNQCTGSSETAWGAGTQFNAKGNWAMYFTYVVKECIPPTGQGTYTIGYWKTHAGFGPQEDVVTDLLPVWLGTAGEAKSVQVTTAAQAVSIFDGAGGQNKINMLYAQMLGAKLSIANGADDSAVASTIAAADAFLATHDAGDWSSLTNAEISTVTGWADTFAQYNEGIIGPGHA